MSVPGDFFDDKGRFVPDRLVRHIISRLSGHYLITPQTDEGGDTTWCYHEDLGIYRPDGSRLIKKVADEALGPRAKIGYITETLEIVRIRTYMPREEFIEKPDIIVVRNGVLHVDTGELTDHDPGHYAKAALPVDYDPDATCPRFLKFLNRVAPAYIDFLQEWTGYHLLKDQRFQRFIILLGDGDNGKSTYLHVLSSLIGPDNVATQSLYRITTNRFAVAELHSKLANIVADIGPDEIKYTGALKIATGEDRGAAERKFKDPFNFVNYAKLSFSCNQLPKTPDETLAFYKRAIYLTFDIKIPIAEQDDTLKTKLTTPEELSGILNWALEGLRRALERHRLDEPTTIEERKIGYRRLSNPVASFAEDYLIEDVDEWETKEDVYQAFARYCTDTGFVVPSDSAFFKDLKKEAYYHAGSKTIKKQRTQVLLGIKLTGAVRGAKAARGMISKVAVMGGSKVGDPLHPSQPLQASSDDVLEAPPHEAALFVDALKLLKAHGGKMYQQAFFEALVGLGYNHMQADRWLRADPRFVFMGTQVKFVGGGRTG